MFLGKKWLTALMVISTMLLLSACGSKAYEIDKELNVEFEGYDEYGEAIVNIDKDILFTEISELLKLKDDIEYGDLENLLSELTVEATPNEKLKNGDETELALLYDEENELKLDLKLKESKLKVEELEPIKTLSKEEIFGGIDIEYEGVSPFLNAVIIENSSSDVSNMFEYSIPEQRFTAGEEIEITAESHSDLTSSGYKADEKDFTDKVEVTNTEKYAETWDDLDKEDKKYVSDEIQDVVTAQIDAEIKDGMNGIYDKGDHAATGSFVTEHGKSKAVENYFLFKKETNFENDTNNVNGIRIIYKNDITTEASDIIKEYSNKKLDYFSVVGVSTLILDKDGKLDRNELHVDTYGVPDINKEEVKNEVIYKEKDEFAIDEFEMENKD